MRALVITFLFFLPVCLRADQVIYSDVFHRHYPVRGGRDVDLARYTLESPSVIWDDSRQRKITVLRTRGDQYPYEDQKCVITVEGSGLDTPRVLSATDFRTVDTSWITGKLVLIRLGIGHIAAVEAIYDTEKDSWIYCESVHYIKNIEPVDPPNDGPATSVENSDASGGGRHR